MVDFNVQRINNRALRTSDRVTFFQIFKWITVGCLLMSMTLSYAWIQHQILSINYEVQDLLTENARLTSQNEALAGRVRLKTTPDEVEARGRAMGLIPANEESVVIIDAETGPETLGMLADAASQGSVKVK